MTDTESTGRLTIIRAVLGSYFLKEELGTLGKLGCAMCLIGSVIIVLHAPPDKDIQTVDEILDYAIKPGGNLNKPTTMISIAIADTGPQPSSYTASSSQSSQA
jgi:hypothetical protein